MDSALSQDKSEFGVLISAALLKMLSNVDSLLDEVVKVLWDLRGEATLLQDSEDFASGDALHLRNSVTVSESYTDLRRRSSLLCHFTNLLNEVVGGNIYPAWCGLSVREASASDTLALGVHPSHFVSSAI